MTKTHFLRSTAAIICALGLAACGGADADIDTVETDRAYAPVTATPTDYAVTYDANEDVMGALETSDDYDADDVEYDFDDDDDLDMDDDDDLDMDDVDYDYADVTDYSPEPK